MDNILAKYSAYDICKNENGELELSLYRIFLKKDSNSKERFYSPVYVGTAYPTDLKEAVEELRANNFHFLKMFIPKVCNVDCDKPLVSLYFIFNSPKLAIIEEFYTTKVVNNTVKIFTYVVYVDATTGLVHVKKTRNLGAYSEDKIINLEDEGVISIDNSYLKKSANKINTPKKLELSK